MNQVTLTANEQPDTQTKTTERTCQGQRTNKWARRAQETLTSDEDSKHLVESSNKNRINPENNYKYNTHNNIYIYIYIYSGCQKNESS